MSYEGYVQLLCAKGHLTMQDCYLDEPKKCWCKEPIVWGESVNTTNDEGHPTHLKEKSRKVCKECQSVLEDRKSTRLNSSHRL